MHDDRYFSSDSSIRPIARKLYQQSKEIPIFAYPSKNEKASYYDLNKVTESLEKRIQSKLEDGKIRESDRLKKYFENIILPLKQRVNPSSSS